MENKKENPVCAAYIRVSTHDQEEYSPDSQIKLIRDYAKKNGLILPEEYIFRDDGVSGRKAEKRPGFLQMIATAKEKPCPFSRILVWKFSRFARNQEESIVYKSLLKKESGVEVVSISEPIIAGPFGELIERIIEWFDAFYSANLGVEVRRGMAERASRGEGVSAPPLGYVYQEKKLTVAPEEAEIVRMVYRDFLNGMPMISIAKKLNSMGAKTKRGGTWENRTVRYLLTNPIYAGKIRWSREGANNYHTDKLLDGTLVVDGQHGAIIDPKDFELVQQAMQEHFRLYKGTGDTAGREAVSHMLQGLVRCDACGSTLTHTSTGLNCSGYVHGRCTVSHFISMQKAEQLILSALRLQLGSLNFELIRRESPALAGEQQHLRQRIKKEQDILRRCKEAYRSGVDTLSEYQEAKKEIQMRIEKLERELAKTEIRPVISKEEFAEKNLKLLEELEKGALSPREKNALLRSFVDHIVYHKDPVAFNIVYYA